MPDKIDMSLDDIIKQNKGKGGARGGARGARGGQRFNKTARGPLRRPLGGIRKRRSGGPVKSAPLKGPIKVPDGKWAHDLYTTGRGGLKRTTPLTTSAKLVITNLDFGVSDQDIKELFEDFGTIKKAAVHYDRSGRSLGTADVIFEKKQDAIQAIKKYNGVQLDGRPMNIELVNGSSAPTQQQTSQGPQHHQQRNGSTASFARRGGGRGGRRGGGRQSNNKQTKTAAELDAELESYAAKMQTD